MARRKKSPAPTEDIDPRFKRRLESIERALAAHERAKGLMENELFRSWLEDEIRDAEAAAAAAVAGDASTYTIAKISGRLSHLRFTWTNLVQLAEDKRRTYLERRLEEVVSERSGETELELGDVFGAF